MFEGIEIALRRICDVNPNIPLSETPLFLGKPASQKASHFAAMQSGLDSFARSSFTSLCNATKKHRSHINVPVFGPNDARIPDLTQRLSDGDRITLPHFDIELEVMDIPGHTRSHIAFYGGGMLFSGDTLFAVGCGRLFEGTPQQMHTSLQRLARTPDATRVYCGHEYTVSNIRFAKAVEPGNKALLDVEKRATEQRAKDLPTLPSNIGQEKATNPFLRVQEPEVIASASRHAGKPLHDPVSVLAAIRDWKNNF